MTTDKKCTPNLIAATAVTYHIPLYQRLFEWGEKQICGLMSDLYAQFAADCNKDYYIGMLTATHDNELVDGQQRFTVVMLIGTAFYKMNEIENKSVWRQFLAIDSNTELRLRFEARPYDEAFLRHLIFDDDFTKPNVKMRDGLGHIKDFLLKIPKEQLQDFSNYVLEHLAFFITRLPKEYEGVDLNKYFETMNSGGKGLENFEILKVELLRNMDEQDKKVWIWNKVSQLDKLLLWQNKDYGKANLLEDTRKKFLQNEIECDSSSNDEKMSQTILEIITDKNRVVERPKRGEKESDEYAVVSFPEFLLLVLDLTINPTVFNKMSYDTSKLLETFQEKLVSKRDKELVSKFYNNLYWYRLLLDLFIIRVQKDNDGNNMYALNFCDANSQLALKQYQSMLYVSTSYHLWLKPLLFELKRQMDSNQIPTASEILFFLKKTDDDLRNNGLEIQDSLAAEKMTYGNIDRYWFWRLDYYLWEKNEKSDKNEKDDAISKYIFRSNRSIEHLHPQDQSENDNWDKTLIDSFGNLAMISTGFNSTQSNDPVGVKFSRIKDQHDKKQLQSIKLWKMYERANSKDLHWTSEMVEEHKKEMLEILRNSFNPNNPNEEAENRSTE